MLRKKAISFIVLLLICSSVYSQQWVKTFNGSAGGDDRATNSVIDIAGNIYVTGYATRTGTGIDFCTVKYNSAGVQQWVSYYNGPGNDEDKPFGIAVDNAGNVYVAGYSTGIGTLADFTTIKYNSSGAEQWVQRYNTNFNGDDRAFGIAVDEAGYVYVTGYVSMANIDMYTVKYKPNGTFIWGQRFYGNGNGEDKSFGIVTDGMNIIITGYVTDGTGNFDIATVNYDSSGTAKWSKIYNGSGNGDDRAFGIVTDAAFNYIFVTGYSTGLNSGTDITTIRYRESNGDTVWVRKYNGPGNANDRAFGIATDLSGNIYVTGAGTGIGTGSDYVTIKYKASGQVQWTSTYNDLLANGDDISYSVVIPKQQNYVFVTGSSIHSANYNPSPGTEDIVTIRYSIANGQQTQMHRYAGSFGGSDVGVKVVADTSGNIFVAGYTQSAPSDYNWVTYKFNGSDITGVKQISTSVPEDYMLYQNFPNPFNPSTKIKFDINKPGIVKLNVYDILGKQSVLLLNKYLNAGTYEAEYNFSDFSSGIYFYELSAGDFKEVKKMILLK